MAHPFQPWERHVCDDALLSRSSKLRAPLLLQLSSDRAAQDFSAQGQAEQLTAYRERMGLSRKEFASQLGIPESSLRDWEEGSKRISRASWEKYFQGGMIWYKMST